MYLRQHLSSRHDCGSMFGLDFRYSIERGIACGCALRTTLRYFAVNIPIGVLKLASDKFASNYASWPSSISAIDLRDRTPSLFLHVLPYRWWCFHYCSKIARLSAITKYGRTCWSLHGTWKGAGEYFLYPSIEGARSLVKVLTFFLFSVHQSATHYW